MTKFREKKPRNSENRVQITTTISPEFKKLLEERKIPVCDALSHGARSLLDGDKRDEIFYENKELSENIVKLQEKIRQLALRLMDLEDRERTKTSLNNKPMVSK